MFITKIYWICVHTLCNYVVSPHCWSSKTSWICFHKHCNSMVSLRHLVPFVAWLYESLVTHLAMKRLFSCVGPFMCLCNQNPLPHTLRGFSSVWFLLCHGYLNLWSHTLQWKGFFPVWVLSCAFAIRIRCHTPYEDKVSLPRGTFNFSWRFESVDDMVSLLCGSFNVLLYTLQWKGFSPVWVL